MYAIIEEGGKQYRVEKGDLIRIERIDGEVGSLIDLEEVLMVSTDEDVRIGRPMVEGAKVKARIVEQGKAKKVIVFKIKRRKGYRRKRGHRQRYTGLLIQDITV